ncbi:MAG TPA: KaiC associated regulatory domain-containing protein [Euryarchaeota archaeon]|nr:MAG: KaiC associated regulatory domain-containing protein [Thermococci archaeon]HDI10314.1 KaiC associated regulatory domain-containing protein [Euryarchaeota archaeon]
MEVIVRPKGGDLDEMAKRVFLESIEVLGGLKKLVEYRNLTWLPTLAEASYVVILRNEGMKTYSEIAKELGITEQTVRNIITANKEKVMEYLRGEIDELREHIAGGIAKIAYERLKKEERLGERIEIGQREAEVLDIDWAVHVLARIKGLEFPVNKEELISRLSNLLIKGKRAEEILESMEYPIKNPADLLHKLKEKLQQT